MAAALTIEQLAAESGMTVRNIRAHQARGLLDPPEVRLRVGYYGPEHAERLKLIRHLQEEGFNLAGIKRLLDDATEPAQRLDRFRRALTEPPHAERPELLTLAELGARFQLSPDEAARVMARAQRLGILIPAGEGTFEAPSPTLLAVAEQVVARGISLDSALAVFEAIERHCDAVSEAFVRVFLDEVWDPFQEAGLPAERWPGVEASIEQLRPLATEALVAIFGQRMATRLDAAFGQLGRRTSGLAPVPTGRLRSMAETDADELRADSRARWERASAGWGKRADRIRDWGMPASIAMVDALALQPGQTVLELAAGPGDTGFLAAELVQPGGKLICSDGAEAMLDVARRRAEATGVRGVEFRQLELEWIDLETASVDAVLCRWGIMLILDPEAAAREIRRILRPGKRAALAVWDAPERNPWATIPGRVMVNRGHLEPPDPEAPGMFALAGAGALEELLGVAGFADVVVRPVELARHYTAPAEFVTETIDLSPIFGPEYNELPAEERAAVGADVIAALAPFTAPDGTVGLPGSTLVAVATA